MMNLQLCTLAVFLLSFSICPTSWGQTGDLAEDLKLFRGDRIRDILKQEVSWEYEDTPFAEVISDIQTTYGFYVFLDQSAIDDSLTEDDLIDFDLEDLQMRLALKLILDRFNATYIVRDDVLMVISKDVAKKPEYFIRRIINCKDLLDKIAVAEHNRIEHVREAVQVKKLNSTSTLEQHAANQLIVAIKTSVTPDDWSDVNGSGTLSIVGNCLIIHQTEFAIHRIEMLLEELSTEMEE